MKKKKLVISTDCFLPRWDGIARFLLEIIPRLSRYYDITVIAPKFEGTLKGFEKIAEKTNFRILRKDVFYSGLETLSAHVKFMIYWLMKKDFNISSSEQNGTEIRVIFQKVSSN